MSYLNEMVKIKLSFVFKRVLLYSVLSLISIGVWAQDLNYTHYTANNGLPSSQIHDVVQDKNGFIWFATDNGLSRFDGYRFKNYSTKNGLTDNCLLRFYPQENGEIWVGTFNKTLFHFSGGLTPNFFPFKHNELLKKLPNLHIGFNMHISKSGTVFLSFLRPSLGFISIDKKGQMTDYTFNDNDKQIAIDTESGFSFQTNPRKAKDENPIFNGLIYSRFKKFQYGGKPCYFPKHKAAIFTTSFNENSIQIINRDSNEMITVAVVNEPLALGKYNDSCFWVGYRSGGLSIYDLSGKLLQSMLPGKSITSVYIDSHGGQWFSTLDDGVFYVNNCSIKYHYNKEKSSDWISSLAKDSEENLWIGYYNGDVSILKNNKLYDFYCSSAKRPSTIEVSNNGRNVFFSSDYKIFNDKKQEVPAFDFRMGTAFLGFCCNGVDSFVTASYGAIYLSFSGINKRIRTDFRVNDVCFFKGRYFFGTYQGLYTLGNNSITRISDARLNNIQVINLTSSANRLYVATKGSGFLIVDDDKIKFIDSKLGLSSNFVSKIYPQNDSLLWACTSSGLNFILIKNDTVNRIDVFSVENGLISNEITDVEIIKDTVWVGTRLGLNSIPLSSVYSKKVYKNYFLKTNYIKLNDSIVSGSALHSLNYDQNRIEFGYSGVSFSGNRLLYRYKLSGYDLNWIYSESLSATYTSLAPGSYTFLVQLKGENASWESSELSIKLTINPPFWRTWWFIAIVVTLLCFIIYSFFKYKILSYNRDITRELLRLLVKKFSGNSKFVVFKEQGKLIRIPSQSICYVKACGNYIEIHLELKKHVVRYKIGDFLELVPDPLEYVRISRSYIVRIDKVQEKSKKEVRVRDEVLPVGDTYMEEIQKILF